MAESSSTSAFVTTLIFNGIIAIVCLILFLALRPRNERVYQPRSLKDVSTISEEERTDVVPSGYFKWVPFLLTRPHSYLIQHASVDGYFFLRYLGIVACVSFMSFFILFPILLPVNATNGRDFEGFELLALSNITNKNRLYAHVFLSWIWFGFIIYVIYRELVYYVVFRHALQTTPLYDGLLSSRTIILTELDKSYNEGELLQVFPNAVKVSFANDQSRLQQLCQRRSKLHNNMESILNKLINKSVKMYRKAQKNEKYSKKLYGSKRKDDLETYVPHNKRPSTRVRPDEFDSDGHYLTPKETVEKKKERKSKLDLIKPTFLFGKKVNSLQYSKEHLHDLDLQIEDAQNNWDSSKLEVFRTCFITFSSQLDAQKCYQSLPYLLDPKQYGQKYIGYSANDINWSNLNLTTKTRKSKRSLANFFLILMIIFWALPVAVVGCISNISFLTDKVYFLRFINNLPNFLLGLITGILPTIALAILMSLVPPIIKLVGRLSGSITQQQNDLYCQAWYYAFQVIQVFLVTTASSSASATVIAIIDDPDSAMTLLANNLPKASNFYIAYFLLLGLTVPSGSLLQTANLIKDKTLGRFFDSTPRQKWTRYNTLDKPSWGVIYPTVEIVVCILISYSVIAPIVLFFSTVALFLMYLAWVYNLNYVLGFQFDSKGRNYPRALFHIFVGIYLSEVCLLGLFIMDKSWGPLVLECVILVITAACHVYFKRKFQGLFDCVPLSAIRYARGEKGYTYPMNDLGTQEIKETGEEFKKKLEDDETGGIIRPATRQELKNANLLKETEHEDDEGEAYNDEDNKVKEYEGEDSEKTEYDEETLKKKGSVASNNSNNLRRASTFVGEDEEFHKLHYEDIENLPKQPLDIGAYDPPQGTVLGRHGATGNLYSDTTALTNQPAAFPPNITRSNTWSRRIINFFHPKKSFPFANVRMRLPHVLNSTVDYDEAFTEMAYVDPAVSENKPIVWIARDPMGVSKQQIEESKTFNVNITDDFAEYDDNGRSKFTFNPPDYDYEIKK